MRTLSFLLKIVLKLTAFAAVIGLLVAVGLRAPETQAHLGNSVNSKRVAACDRALNKLRSSPYDSWQVRMQAWLKCQSLPDRRAALYDAVR